MVVLTNELLQDMVKRKTTKKVKLNSVVQNSTRQTSMNTVFIRLTFFSVLVTRGVWLFETLNRLVYDNKTHTYFTLDKKWNNMFIHVYFSELNPL